ncbi:MAG TPA: 4Fe-4S dicluster domain-containing protein [Anaerolineales bacterium]|nr:4Fe-4S dicluster domain-containing protein [Anaerolineales bacterium]
MEKQLFANPDLCTGCNRCVYACSAVKEGAFEPRKARLKITNFASRGYSVPNICFQCPKADCQAACPTDAFSRNSVGVVTIEPDKCIACGACAAACTYGMVEQDEAGIAFKCDRCDGDPACVKECHADALQYVPADSELIRLKSVQMKTRTKNGSARDKRQQLAEKLLKNAR